MSEESLQSEFPQFHQLNDSVTATSHFIHTMENILKHSH